MPSTPLLTSTTVIACLVLTVSGRSTCFGEEAASKTESPDSAGNAYFPKDLETYGLVDGDSPHLRIGADCLRAMQEESIYAKRSDTRIRELRFLYRPAKAKPLALHAFKSANGRHLVKIIRLSGPGGYADYLGKPELKGDILIQGSEFEHVFRVAGLPEVNAPWAGIGQDRICCMDGDEYWVMESLVAGKYTLTCISMPRSLDSVDKILGDAAKASLDVPVIDPDVKPFMELWEYLLELTDMKIPECPATRLLDARN